MEVSHDETLALEDDTTIALWETNQLRVIHYDPLKTRLVNNASDACQVIYKSHSTKYSALQIRRSKGFPITTSLLDLIWILCKTSRDMQVLVAVDPAFVFNQTGALVNRRIVEWNDSRVTPVFEISTAVVVGFTQLLDLQFLRFAHAGEQGNIMLDNYLSVDDALQTRFYIFSDAKTLEYLEVRIRDHSESVWQAKNYFGKKVNYQFNFYLYPRKKFWSIKDLENIEQGDLLDLENFVCTEGSDPIKLRGNIQYQQYSIKNRYEVFLAMNADNTQLEFGIDSMSSEQNTEQAVAPHEEIELEVYAGSTRLFFNELCTIQEGTLLELREHSLPQVTLSVNGNPLMEGELVQFQGQIMVQITRIL